MTIIHRQQFSIVDNNKLISDEYTCIQEVSWLHEITIPPLQLADEHNHVPAPGGREGVIKSIVAPEISARNSTNAALAATAVVKKAHIFFVSIHITKSDKRFSRNHQ